MRLRLIVAVLAFTVALPLRAAELRLEPDLVIGDGEPLIQFFTDVVVDSRGHIFVADSGLGHIHEFAPDGVWRTRIGTFGAGPGDLPRKMAIAMGAADDLIVTGMTSRIDLLGTDGTWRRGTQRIHPASFVRSVAVAGDGRIAVVAPDFASDTVVDVYTAELESDGSCIASFAKKRWNHRLVFSTLAGGEVAFCPSGDLVYARGAPFEIVRVGVDGTVKDRTSAGGEDFVTVPHVEIEGDRVGYRGFCRTTGLVVWSDGRIVASSYRADVDVEPESLITIHDRGLNLLARLVLDGSHRIVGVDREDRVFVVTRGEASQELTRNRLILPPRE